MSGKRRDVDSGSGAPRSAGGCIVMLVLLLVLGGGGWFVVSKAGESLGGLFGSAEDYPGPGHGQVTFQVHEDDTLTAIGRNLKAAGIVASVDAFIGEANANPESTGIQVGYYEMKLEMSAKEALQVLLDPGNQVSRGITIPEGFTVAQIVDRLVAETRVTRAEFTAALASGEIGLPKSAHGNAEGYLFPATYDFAPKASAVEMLSAMVDRWRQAADDLNISAEADRLGITEHELMTVASLVQAEARGKYMPKVARVIYNRLYLDNNETYGLLQIDATVNYATGNSLLVRPTDADRAVDSPYNTYKYPGLPPGPIEAPGEDAIRAATRPADGPWLYYVTVNLATGETKFATTLAEHNANVAELNEYCATQSDRC